MELAASVGEAKYADAARAALAYERRWLDAESGNWLDLRDVHRRDGDAPKPARCGTTWCHGAPGIALSRIRAHELTGDEVAEGEAAIALETTRRIVEHGLTDGSMNFSLCHGLAGNADVLLHAERSVPRAGGGRAYLAGAREAARAVGDFGIDRYGARNRGWPCGAGHGETPALMVGLSGVGYFYLRLYSAAVPSILSVSPGFCRSGSPGSGLRSRRAAGRSDQVPTAGTASP